MPSLSWADLRREAAALDGATILTLGERKPFTVRLLPDALEFVPVSSGRSRRHPRSVAERVLERFNQRCSLTAGHYKDLTAHASYVVALLHAITRADKTAPTDVTARSPMATPRRPADNQGTAREGRSLVRAELERRRMSVREVREGHVILLEASGPGEGPIRHVRVKTRRSGTWQASTSDGDANAAPPTVPTVWAFVDLSVSPPRFHLAEDAAVRRDIAAAHGEYLVRNAGRRVRNAGSRHHAISLQRVERLSGGWELLGIDPTADRQ